MDIVNRLSRLLIRAVVAFLSVFAATRSLADQPNVVLVFVDDLGYGDLGCYGATKVQTPNIDRLAKEGRRFTDAHSASAVCTPSRYALLTGQYPLMANGGKGAWGPLPITSGLIIDTKTLTIGWVFKNRGYATACLGKWHLGFKQGRNDWKVPLRPGPRDVGFDHYFGIPVVNSAPPYVYVEDDTIVGYDPSDPLVYGGKPASPTPTFPTEASVKSPNRFSGALKAHRIYDDEKTGTLLTEKAVKWIADNKKKPFFLYFSTPNIHHPFTPAPRFKGTSQCGLYGDFVHELDWMVGEILKCLEDNNLSDNTLVIFTSDNGGMLNLAGRNAVKAGHKMNGDLLGFKFGVWEGGHRVPFIARWPGKIKAGTESDQLICQVDLLATFMALTGQDVEALKGKDSVNMLPALIEDPDKPLRTELLLAPRQPRNLAIRKGKWMYIGARGSGGFTGSRPNHHAWGGPAAAAFVGSANSDIEDGRIKKDAPPAQLYDLEKDLAQTRNVYREKPEVAKQMEALLDSYRPRETNGDTPKKRGPRKASSASEDENPSAPGDPATKTAATPSTRSAYFDFESGKLDPWKVVEGKFGHVIGSRDRYFNNRGAYSKQGKYYLTTLEISADAARGADKQTGVIVSPPFIPKGGEMTFRIGGGRGRSTYVALCLAGGKELIRARGANTEVMQKVIWDLAPYAGKKLFLKVVDQSTTGWGHVTVDNFQFDAEVMTQSPETQPHVTPNVPAAGKPTRAPNEDGSEPAPGRPSLTSMRFSTQKVAGIGHEPGVCRRDPSDVIKVGETYYVWYSKVARGQRLYPSGYAASVWCATSTDDGRSWAERGQAVGKGPKGAFDSHGVFTPNILAHGGKYYLYYTAVGSGFTNSGYSEQGKARIAVAVSDSPDGPWTKPESNIVIEPSKDKSRFDSFRCDDSALLVHEGKIWLYYKGRQWGRTPRFTKMGVAVATDPLGPFVKQNDGEPVQPEGHEVVIWTEGDGVVSLVTSAGRGVYYSTDRLRFKKIASEFTGKLMAPGAYRRDLTDPRDTSGLRWGIAMVPGKDPYLVRFVRAIGADTTAGFGERYPGERRDQRGGGRAQGNRRRTVREN